MKILIKPCVALAAMLTTMAALAQEVGATNRGTELKADSRADSATVAMLAKETVVTVISRVSGWARVQAADKKTGWVRAFHLSFKSGITQSASGNTLGVLGGLLSPARRETPKTISTVGIRGLSEEEMKSARANPVEFNKMKSYAASKPDAEAFARRSHLAAVSVAYVDANGKPIAGGEK